MIETVSPFANRFKGTQVLVTGHTGFKGSWLCQWLLQLGAKVTGYSLDIPSEPCHFKILNLAKEIDHVEGDILNREKLITCFAQAKPEVVFHLAAQSLVRRAYEQPILTFETNAIGTANVLEAIRKTSSVKAAVIITSDKCYENVNWEYGYRETDPLGGADPYSASKACAEIIFSSFIRSFLGTPDAPRLASARAGNVLGGGDWSEHRILPDCVRAWSKNEAPSIRFPHSTRPWQHVLEPLSGYLWLASLLLGNKGDELHGESFNFGPAADANYTVRHLIDECRKTWPGKEPKYGEVPPGTVYEAGLLKLSCDKAPHPPSLEIESEFR